MLVELYSFSYKRCSSYRVNSTTFPVTRCAYTVPSHSFYLFRLSYIRRLFSIFIKI